MRSIVLLMTCLATIAVSLGASSRSGDSANFGDQGWWNGLARSERVHVVQGMLVAFGEAYDQGVLHALEYAAKRENHSNGWVMETRRYVHVDGFSRPVGYYVDGISAYYSKHAGGASLNTDVGQILGCLADSPALNCDELAKAVEGG